MSSTIKRTPKQSLIGLDIGAGGIRAVQLHREASCWTVVRATSSLTGSSENTNTIRMTGLGGRIAGCLGNSEFRGRKATIALSSPDVEFHTLELPQAVLQQHEAQVSAVVRSEMEGLADVQGAEFEAAHWTLPPGMGASPNTLCVAARHELVQELVDVSRAARVECVCVDTAASALSRFGAYLKEWKNDELWGILDVGLRQSRLLLCVDNTPVLVRTAGPGGAGWTEVISEALEISTKAAEVQKCQHGLTRPNRSQDRLDEDDIRTELGSMMFGSLRRILKGMGEEIKRSYEYVLGCYPNMTASDLVLVGGGAAMRSLPEHLSDELGITVHSASHYLTDGACRLRYASARSIPFESFALAVGLALPE